MYVETPWRELQQAELKDCHLALLGIPFDGAVSAFRGAAAAPGRIRELSKILPPFTEEGADLRGFKVSDLGNIPPTLNWEHFFMEVEQQAAALMQAAPFSLFLGGDHSVTIPLIKAFAARHAPHPVGVIHLDSHCDLMDSYGGHIWSHACTQRRTLEQGNIAPAHLALVGIRSYEADEIDFLKAHPEVMLIGARQHYCQGLPATVEKVCAALAPVSAVYLSLDIDVLDPAFAPGTGTPEGGGLSTREVMELVKAFCVRLPVKAADVVEVSPPLDHSDITSWAALKIIYELFGVLAGV